MQVTAPPYGKPQEPPLERSQGSAFWYLLSTAVTAALPLVVLPVITRALAPEQYGAWVLAYAYAMFVSTAANLGLPVVYERSYFE